MTQCRAVSGSPEKGSLEGQGSFARRSVPAAVLGSFDIWPESALP